jgi:hypothetical protein
MHIGSVDGNAQNTKKMDFSLDWLRINTGQALGANDPIIPQQPLPPCRIAVTPVAQQQALGEVAGATTPSQFVYTITNAGQNTINQYTVTEVDSQGQPFDHTWLSLDKTSGGPLVTDQTDTVTATLTTTGLDAGTHTAYLKFTDDCSPATEFTREIVLTVTNCRYAVTPLESVSQGYAIRARNCPLGQQYVFTVSNIGADPLTYKAEESLASGNGTFDWPELELDAAHWDAGTNQAIPVTIQPGMSDTVTVTITAAAANITNASKNTNIRFTKTCAPADVQVRQVRIYNTVFDTPLIWTYNGSASPDTADSFGLGYTFVLFPDADLGDPGAVVDDPEAIDGKALRIVDDATHRTRWHNSPSSTPERIVPRQGATIVARVKVESATNPPGGNISLYNGDGLTCDYSFGGPNNGRIKEVRRNKQNDNQDRANSDYHIIRLTAIGGGDTGIARRIRLYYDENPQPVLDINDAAEVITATDYFGFGVTNTGAVQTISFDWITATNAGAYAPGEEMDCLSQQLCLGPNCYRDPTDCYVPAVDGDGDGDVDMMDFAMFQLCLTTGGGTLADECKCFDRDGLGTGDGDVDGNDFFEFQKCATGPNVLWTQLLSPECVP